MSVYVDPLFDCRPFAEPGSFFHRVGQSCHMMADSDDELHSFALTIGLRLEWHQPCPPHRLSHYDLTPPKRRLAIRFGAIEVPAGHKPGDPLPKGVGGLLDSIPASDDYGW